MIRKKEREAFPVKEHEADFCVVGGGLAGMCAAIAAARRGSRVVLMQDRPVLGGNASSEIRMWIRGANGRDVRETGLVEEIALVNCYRNPDMNFSIWDSVLYEMVMQEKNIRLLLNCSCLDAEMQGNRIVSVTGWQLTTQTYHRVNAGIFADCSGDSILAPLTGAAWRMGRESREEFGEDIAPKKADACTMGMSCLIQARQTGRPVRFLPPKWAHHYTREDFPYRMDLKDPDQWKEDNFWWMEIGGTKDAIHDTEELRDELLKIAYGVWDFIKNSGEVDAKNWDLEWMGFLPGKRESRRYEGAYILKQEDVRTGGRFPDLIGYGGWTMDDHDPRGFQTKEKPNLFHPAPSPYGIPYRCLYSSNIENLMFAGRNISTTHTANSSTRVMATCGILGQAVGTAAALACRLHIRPAQVWPEHIHTLQQELLEDGCYLPGYRRECGAVMEGARITCGGREVPVLLDGLERSLEGTDHAWEGEHGEELILTLPQPRHAESLRLVFDSDLNRDTWENQKWYVKRYPMKCNSFLDDEPVSVPGTLLRAFEIWMDAGEGTWEKVCDETENYRQIRFLPLKRTVKRVKLVPKASWGTGKARLYAMELTADETQEIHHKEPL